MKKRSKTIWKIIVVLMALIGILFGIDYGVVITSKTSNIWLQALIIFIYALWGLYLSIELLILLIILGFPCLIGILTIIEVCMEGIKKMIKKWK